jgi:hypothetical protein
LQRGPKTMEVGRIREPIVFHNGSFGLAGPSASMVALTLIPRPGTLQV